MRNAGAAQSADRPGQSTTFGPSSTWNWNYVAAANLPSWASPKRRAATRQFGRARDQVTSPSATWLARKNEVTQRQYRAAHVHNIPASFQSRRKKDARLEKKNSLVGLDDLDVLPGAHGCAERAEDELPRITSTRCRPRAQWGICCRGPGTRPLRRGNEPAFAWI